ncbi:MAG TPA: HAD-IIB family hydrolase [Candidatus Methylacidiphilales bacterium]|nr:HAD-IIB family hydrolase [Candidatus Methylacidiphilales bacterium]
MRYLALATDYDGTLAHDGCAAPETIAAIRRLKESGRKAILVSGRQLPDLQEAFPDFNVFDLIVAENGALLFDPMTKKESLMAEAPPPKLAEELRRRGAIPLAEGRVILATWQPHETVVFETIRDLGLEMQVIFNKGAVMILPSGINKASGLAAALETLGLSPHNVVAVGDAENDHALLQMSEAGVAVSNALPALMEKADLVTKGDHGRGVVELIDGLLENDLYHLAEKLKRHDLMMGKLRDESPMNVPAYGTGILIAGTSGGGKSTLAATVIEQLLAKRYQFCIIDPEGDFAEMENAVILGDAKRAPSPDEVMTILAKPLQNCVVSLIGLKLDDRPTYFEKLFAELLQLRIHTGRPHWVILDEAHHILPSAREQAMVVRPSQLANMLFITLEPEHVAKSILKGIDLILAIGKEPAKTITTFSHAIDERPPPVPSAPLEKGLAMAWWRKPQREPFVFESTTPTIPRHRHIRKYAEGDVKQEAFVFTGPDHRLKLRAQNLFIFLQIGEGVDDLTWDYHLRNGDYENWFRWTIKDRELAEAASDIAAKHSLSPEETRHAIREVVEKRYTVPK